MTSRPSDWIVTKPARPRTRAPRGEVLRSPIATATTSRRTAARPACGAPSRNSSTSAIASTANTSPTSASSRHGSIARSRARTDRRIVMTRAYVRGRGVTSSWLTIRASSLRMTPPHPQACIKSSDRLTTRDSANGSVAAMRTWTATTTAPARPEAVLEVLTDPDAAARWAPVPFDVDDLDGERLLAGSRARVSGKLAGRKVGFDVRVHEADESGIALSASGAGGRLRRRLPAVPRHVWREQRPCLRLRPLRRRAHGPSPRRGHRSPPHRRRAQRRTRAHRPRSLPLVLLTPT